MLSIISAGVWTENWRVKLESGTPSYLTKGLVIFAETQKGILLL